MTTGSPIRRRLVHGLTMYPVMVAATYVVGRLVTNGGEWLAFALIFSAALTAVLVILPGAAVPHDPPAQILHLAIQMTAWWIFGAFHRWAGEGTDWLLYWLVALVLITYRFVEVRRWEEPPPEG
jgi:hypothetical protein